MTKPRPRPLIEPRGLTAGEVAFYLGISPVKFTEIKERLYERGFPRPDPDTGRYDVKAVDFWWDSESGIVATSPSNLSEAERELEKWAASA